MAFKYLLGEMWLSPCQTMVSNTISKEKTGSYTGAFYFFAAISSTISTAFYSFLAKSL
jgi:hypothetical protein